MHSIAIFLGNSLKPILLATAIAGLVIWSGSGCSGKDPLIISAASSLGPVLEELKPAAEAACGSRIALNLAGSGVLRTQIEGGAPADVFFSAAPSDMHILADAGLIERETWRDIAANTLVLVAARKHTNTVTNGDLRTILAGWSRIAAGDPAAAPVGRHTTNVLARLKLERVVYGKTIPGNSVRQIVSYLETGSVDGGFVFATDADRLVKAGKARVIVRFRPEESGGLVRYPAAVLSRSRNPEAARRFVAFLASKTAQTALSGAGFIIP